jgi:hypothetical protein
MVWIFSSFNDRLACVFFLISGWHPGNRVHQLNGRVITFALLQALKEALVLWNETEGYNVTDDQWHITSHYENVRKNVYDHSHEGACNDLEKTGVPGISLMCKFPMKGRTEFTPRAYPSMSSIRSLMSQEMLLHIDPAPDVVYNPPDVFNPSLHPPEGAIDVLSIVEAGPPFRPVLVPDYFSTFYKKPRFSSPPKVPVGKGVSLDAEAGDPFCDGTVDSWCSRGKHETCLLKGANDGRHGLLFDGYSGWVVLNIPDVKNGLIMVKVETWHPGGAVAKTKGWNSINNEEEKAQRKLASSQPNPGFNSRHNMTTAAPFLHSYSEIYSSRNLKRKKKGGGPQEEPFCDEFQLEYAIDGNITTLNVTDFNTLRVKGAIQRVIELFVLLNDREYNNGDEKEVEVGLRITGCSRKKTFKLSHIYWS